MLNKDHFGFPQILKLYLFGFDEVKNTMRMWGSDSESVTLAKAYQIVMLCVLCDYYCYYDESSIPTNLMQSLNSSH